MPRQPRARKARVLHVAHNCLPHVGGLETVVAAETRGLGARGWDVTVLSSAHTVGPGVREEAGVRTVRVRAWNGLEARFGVPFPVFSPWLLVACAQEVRRADLVHVHDPLYLSSWAAVLCCLVLGKPYVVHRHVGFVHHSSALVRLVQRTVLGTVGRLVLDRARAVLPIDDHIAADTRTSLRDPERVVVVGNGVDTTRFRPASDEERRRSRDELGLPAQRPLVLFVARFVPKKGFATVAAAASGAYDLVFAGDERPPGYDAPRLHFLGSVTAEDMPRVYRAADVMVVASVGECPLTVLEALASGLPVMANDDPSLHTSWTAGPGVVFVDMTGGGPGALRAALERLVVDLPAARRTGREGEARVRTAFSWEAHVDRLEAVYGEVLDQTRRTHA